MAGMGRVGAGWGQVLSRGLCPCTVRCLLANRHLLCPHMLLGSLRSTMPFNLPSPHPSSLPAPGCSVQDLLCAAMHSRAAYGFAMAAGHVSSVSSYIKLQTLQPLT